MDIKDIQRLQQDFRQSLINGKPVEMVKTRDRELRDSAFRGCASGMEFPGDGWMTTVRDLALMNRAQNVGASAAGGYTVTTSATEPEIALRPPSATLSAGAQMVVGLLGDHREVREDTPMTFSFGSEIFDGTESDAVFAATHGSPHRMVGAGAYSTQLEAQGGPRFSRYLSNTILAGVGAAIDRAALVGTGIAGEPLGIFNAPTGTGGVGTIQFGGAPSVSKVADFEKTIVNLDGTDANIFFLAHGSVRAKWKSTVRFTNGGAPLWDDSEKVLGKSALVTSAIANTDVVAGDFKRQVVLFWGSPEIPVFLTVDRITMAKSGQVRVIANVFCDIIFTRLNQFVKNADSATQ